MITKFKLESALEILDSGTVIQSKVGDNITLYVTEYENVNIAVRFEFIKDANNPNIKSPESAMASLIDYSSDTVKIEVRYKSSALLNFGYIDPVKIGTYYEKNLFFNFRVSINSDIDVAIINYTWYISKEVVTK